MTAFNFYSHVTQDLYPTFLQVQHKLLAARRQSHRRDLQHRRDLRRYPVRYVFREVRPTAPHHHRGAAVAAGDSAMLAFSSSPVPLAIGAFLMQFTVQGAFGHHSRSGLNELSPDTARGAFPGFVYKLGNLLASVNATLQAGIAAHLGGNYGIALASVAVVVALVIAGLTAVGGEARASYSARQAAPCRSRNARRVDVGVDPARDVIDHLRFDAVIAVWRQRSALLARLFNAAAYGLDLDVG